MTENYTADASPDIHKKPGFKETFKNHCLQIGVTALSAAGLTVEEVPNPTDLPSHISTSLKHPLIGVMACVGVEAASRFGRFSTKTQVMAGLALTVALDAATELGQWLPLSPESQAEFPLLSLENTKDLAAATVGFALMYIAAKIDRRGDRFEVVKRRHRKVLLK